MSEASLKKLELQIQKDLQRITEKVFEEVEKNILKLLQEYIDHDTYNFDPRTNKWYERTNEFRDAFVWEDRKSDLREVTNRFYYDWTTMSSPSSSPLNNGYTHGNPKKDAREYLADWLNTDGVAGNDWGQKQRRAYWDDFNAELTYRIYQWFDEEFAKHGIRR